MIWLWMARGIIVSGYAINLTNIKDPRNADYFKSDQIVNFNSICLSLMVKILNISTENYSIHVN